MPGQSILKQAKWMHLSTHLTMHLYLFTIVFLLFEPSYRGPEPYRLGNPQMHDPDYFLCRIHAFQRSSDMGGHDGSACRRCRLRPKYTYLISSRYFSFGFRTCIISTLIIDFYTYVLFDTLLVLPPLRVIRSH